MTKIAHILYSGLGGHGSVVFSFLSNPESKEFNNHLLFYGIEPLLEEYKQKARDSEIAYKYLNKRQKIDFQGNSIAYKTLVKWQPDVVMLNSQSLIFPVSKYCKKYKAKLIVIDHTNNALKRKTDWMYSSFCISNAKYYVVLTEEFKNELLTIKPKWKKYQYKIKVIPNGIDQETFFPKTTDSSKNSTIKIGMLSRITSIKDHETLIRAFEICKHELKQPIQLILAGDGEKLATLKELASKLNMNEYIHFTGLLNENECANFLQNLDIYVHATFGEALSTAILQAMATKLPIIASDVQGVNNLLENKRNALLIETENAQLLAKTIMELIKKEDLRASLSNHAYNDFLTNYSSSKMFNFYKEIIQY